MQVILKGVFPSQSSVGVLSKGYYSIDGLDHIVKGNSLSPVGVYGWEPYSEVMSSIIADLLGFEHVKYTLMDSALFPEIELFGDVKHVSVCLDYKYAGYNRVSSFYSFLLANYSSIPFDLYGAFMQLLPNEIISLNRMLLLDALVGNEDRHLGNIELVSRVDGSICLSPIFDVGASLLALQDEDKLSFARTPFTLDRSKPFFKTHKRQMDLIAQPLLPYFSTSKFLGLMLDRISPILSLLPPNRSKAIMSYLSWRVNYLKRGMNRA